MSSLAAPGPSRRNSGWPSAPERTAAPEHLRDILGRGFNIDHVVLSKNGIYALEIKTLSKKPGIEATFDGKDAASGRQDSHQGPARSSRRCC